MSTIEQIRIKHEFFHFQEGNSKKANNKCGALSVPLIGSKLKKKAKMDAEGMKTMGSFFQVRVQK